MLIDELLHQPKQKPNRFDISTVILHKYVWSLIGIGILFFATFPLACWRVAQSEKFNGQSFKTLTWQENQKSNLNYPKP